MDVRIQNITGTVTAVGGDALLSPAVLERIVTAVLAALAEQRLREHRASRDTRVMPGAAGDDGSMP
jgi:hypothetical protein